VFLIISKALNQIKLFQLMTFGPDEKKRMKNPLIADYDIIEKPSGDGRVPSLNPALFLGHRCKNIDYRLKSTKSIVNPTAAPLQLYIFSNTSFLHFSNQT